MRWVKPSERLPKRERKGNQYAPHVPVLFVLRKGPNYVCAGRYFKGRVEDGRPAQWVSLQGVAFSTREVCAWAPMPKPPFYNGYLEKQWQA